MRFLILGLSLLAFCPSLVQAQQGPPPGFTGTALNQTMYAVKSVNIRAGAGHEYNVLGRLSQGQPVQILAQTPDGRWFELATGGYVAADLLSVAPIAPPRHRRARLESVVPAPAPQYRIGDCEPYMRTVNVAGQMPQTVRGTACLQPDGTWRIVDRPPPPGSVIAPAYVRPPY